MKNKPQKFRAKRIDGKGWAVGWYAMHHIPEFEDDGSYNNICGYHITHSLFNDEPNCGFRSKNDGYWIDIDPDTLVPMEQQMTLFD